MAGELTVRTRGGGATNAGFGAGKVFDFPPPEEKAASGKFSGVAAAGGGDLRGEVGSWIEL